MKIEHAVKLAHEGRLNEAIDALAPLENDTTHGAAALGHKAWLLRAAGRFDESAEAYRTLAERTGDPVARAWLGDMLCSIGREKEGRAELKTAVSIDPFAPGVVECLRRHVERQSPSERPENLLQPNPTQLPAPNPVLAQLEADEKSFPTSIFPEVGRFIYDLVRLVRPRVAIETGSHIGYSTICIAQAIKDIGQGHLHAFDLFLEKPDYVSPVLGPVRNGKEIIRGHLAAAEIDHLVTLHAGDSASNIEAAFGDRVGKVDFAFIDGDHRIAGAQRDWAAIDPLLAEGAIVLLHDTEPENCYWLGPRHLIEHLEKGEDAAYRWVNLPSPEGFGLAIAEKVKPGGWRAARPRWRDIMLERAFESLKWQ